MRYIISYTLSRKSENNIHSYLCNMLYVTYINMNICICFQTSAKEYMKLYISLCTNAFWFFWIYITTYFFVTWCVIYNKNVSVFMDTYIKSLIYTQKSPIYTQKSPIYTQKSPIYTLFMDIYIKSLIYTQKSPIYPIYYIYIHKQHIIYISINTLYIYP